QGQEHPGYPGANRRRDQRGRQRHGHDLSGGRRRRAGARHGPGARAGARGRQDLRGRRKEHHGIRCVHRDPAGRRGAAPHLRAAARPDRAHRGRGQEGRSRAGEAARGGRARADAPLPQGTAREGGGGAGALALMETVRLDREISQTTAPSGVMVLTDLVRNPVLRPSDLELERNVVLEEINTVEDTPDDQVFDLSYKTLWPEHPYGYSILGTRDTVGAMSTSDLKQLHERAYFPANCVIAAAGNMTHERLLELLGEQGWFDDR